MSIDVLTKGLYSHPQINNFVSVKQYMFVSENDKRYLTVRLSNDAGFTIDEISLNLYQLDSEGNTLKMTRVKQEECRILPGNTFALKELPLLDIKCADIMVKIIYVISGAYRYTVRNDRVIARYIPPKTPRTVSGNTNKRYGARRPRKALFTFVILIMIAAMTVANTVHTLVPLLDELGVFDYIAELITYDYGEENETSGIYKIQEAPIKDIFTIDTMFVDDKLGGENNAEIQ